MNYPLSMRGRRFLGVAGPAKRVISGLLMVSILLVGYGCVSRPDWIEATLVTVDVSGVWSGDGPGVPAGVPFVLELAQQGSKVTGSMRISGFYGRYGGPVEGRVTGDLFQFWQLSNPIKGEATVDGDQMKGQLVWLILGEFTLRRVERSLPPLPQRQ
jgi:hypothetical protein